MKNNLTPEKLIDEPRYIKLIQKLVGQGLLEKEIKKRISSIVATEVLGGYDKVAHIFEEDRVAEEVKKSPILVPSNGIRPLAKITVYLGDTILEELTAEEYCAKYGCQYEGSFEFGKDGINNVEHNPCCTMCGKKEESSFEKQLMNNSELQKDLQFIRLSRKNKNYK